MKHTLQAEGYAPIEAAKENLKYLTKCTIIAPPSYPGRCEVSGRWG